jgi:hypothetical protein
VLGAVLVFFLFPKRAEEEELLARYQAEDTGERVEAARAPETEALPTT